MNTSTSSSRRKQPSSIVRRQVSDELEVSGSSASSSVVSAGGGSGSGSAVAIVPSLNVTSAGESDDGPLRSTVVIDMDSYTTTTTTNSNEDTFTLKDVNSRTNLIEMDRSSGEGEGDDDRAPHRHPHHAIYHPLHKSAIINNNDRSLLYLDHNKSKTGQHNDALVNNSSQSSLDTGVNVRFADETDMIPLMPMINGHVIVAGAKIIPNGKGDDKELIIRENNDKETIEFDNGAMEVSGGDGVGGGGGGGGGGGDRDGEGGSETLDTSSSSNNRAHKMSISHMIHFDERWYTILAQVIIPFLIAGLGMVGAGVVLDIVQHWELYKAITAIFTLIPALLGLKGNLEMTLAARFSTQVNIGKIRDRSTIMSAVLGNFALTQAQAIVVGFLASIGALILKAITKDKSESLTFDDGLVLLAGSMSTASFASLILAGLMMFIIILSKQFNINPDNIATPIAASLGDLVTLTILSYLCTFLYQIKPFLWIHVSIIISFLVLVPVFMYYSYKNDFVRDALFNGWMPIIMAMIISSSGGFIMGFAVRRYEDIAVFQPVVNGVGGNLVAIFASRLSTSLHRTSSIGSLADWAPTHWFNYPFDTFFSPKNPESHTALILAIMSLPGHLIFYFTIIRIKIWQADDLNAATQTPSFVSFYISISVLQVILLLLICYWLVHLAWRLNKDPDNLCIPYLTAIGDLLGTAFLAICFHVLYLAGETRLRSE